MNHRLSGLLVLAAALHTVSFSACADGPKDNQPGAVRRVPRLGVEVAPADRSRLEAGLRRLAQTIATISKSGDPVQQRRLPDVQIFHRAVQSALQHREFFSEREIPKAFRLLQAGQQRADQLQAGSAPWTQQTGLVVRGYVSRLDGSVQPYGLVIPASYRADGTARHRCDVWFHGRGETLSEVNFLDQRSRQVGRIAPADTLVLHPYGRYSNAFKFAGEVDVFEALADVRRNYRVDEDRTAVRGFSMGGAGCWQMAVHFPDVWFAANPGAGFSETPEFLKFFQKEQLNPTWYERKLWQLYDCPGYAENLLNCPTVAYSGELDIQKQAADVMESALKKLGIDLTHIIGPQTKHAIHPESLNEIESRLASLSRRGRDRVPHDVRLTTYTLKYNRSYWITIDGLGEHWVQARVHGKITGRQTATLETRNVTALTLSTPAGLAPFDPTAPVQITIDGQRLAAPRPLSDRSWTCALLRAGGKWQLGRQPLTGLRKRHNLQGPIDDAFMNRFLFVKPTGQSAHPRFQDWSTKEMVRAVEHWRRHFRGEARVKDDTQITPQDIAESHLILWGDPQSNAVLRRISQRLPMDWTPDAVQVGSQTFASQDHGLILVYPNPLNTARYVVLNSGFTYRNYAYLNNARQVPMLPDWAVIDLKTPAGSQYPGRVAAAGFFDEQWQLKP
jgi:hypothetical protein